MPDFETLDDAGLLSKERLLTGNIPAGLANDGGDEAKEQNLDIIIDRMR